ncbi:MAG: lysophospholipid acyltransferase family protein [Chloroflexota bacterium]|nr:lysophospholipid acyltransferase family protein [Chloroflexota bacterium]
MRKRFMLFTRQIAIAVGWVISKVLLDVKVTGVENLPRNPHPLIVIANHFSWFDAPILAVHLPFAPAFIVATESQRYWWFRSFVKVFNAIPIWRGQVDREAFRRSMTALKEGYVLGIFPEGGMDPDFAEAVARGETVNRYIPGRRIPVLARPKSGTALLAIQTGSNILPVALIGTERVYANMLKLRRTPVTIRVGRPFGPLQIDPALRGRARRQRLDELSDLMMQQIAVLFPPENRGPYRNMELTTL